MSTRALSILLTTNLFYYIHSIDYLDHVKCTDSNFVLRGISNDAINSLDGNTRIMIQNDGNLVLSSRTHSLSSWNIIWQTNTDGIDPNSIVFAIQTDGNLVIYTDGNGWQSNTWQGCCQSFTFVVNNGGFAYLLNSAQQTVIWSTNNNPSQWPNYPTYGPSLFPTIVPTNFPTRTPTKNPSINPSQNPTNNPTIIPTKNPSENPSISPTDIPTKIPSKNPTNNPTQLPTLTPTNDDKHGEIVETTIYPTKVTKHIKNDMIKDNSSNNLFWAIMISLLVIIISCILCLVFIMRHKLKKELNKNVIVSSQSHISLNKHKLSVDNTGEMNRNSILYTHSSNPISTDVIIDEISNAPTPIQINDNINVLTHQSIHSNLSEQKSSHITNDNALNNLNLHAENMKDVKKWLSSFRMDRHYLLFISNGYDALHIIKEIKSKKELQEIGIGLKGHQTKIMSEIKKLTNGNDLMQIKGYDLEIKENENNTDEGTETNEDITDPPTEEGDTPNDDGTGSSDINNNDMELLYEKNTKQDFEQNLQNNNMANELLIDDVIDDMSNGNQTPQ